MFRPCLSALVRRPAAIALLLVVPLLALSAPLPGRAADACTLLAGEPLPFPGPFSVDPVPSRLDPAAPGSLVSLHGQGLEYSYVVDGVPTVIRGMGYNPRYTGLPLAERHARYERDFAAMAAAGVNTIIGWNPTEFDGLTLDVAAGYGLGVALPYDLDWRLDYADPAVRDAVAGDILDWVIRYRSHPAVRMWAIGNETFHKLVPPSWCQSPPTAEQKARAEALARFYVDLIDSVHAFDPDHPVLYREAEDSYVRWLRTALAPGGHRPWFMYGLNVYTPRLAEVLGNWSNQGLDAAVLVSEFSPGPESRPAGYRDYWATIRGHASSVLGGAVYVWFAEGPEEIDRVYGLVDPAGRPLDGSLEVIAELYQAEALAVR